ncbi:uncharacterized protein LOC113859618 [Abrus precatorius]|uniref:Uncharacterized protein LOC113859618 n=1 Tax=Abrus precatorius TaxID=3816 RepID=A0A8B8KXQ9_ABRPR|nr:uncharacterized protein LOC113859618 [Abrus precatorius]
MVSRTRFWPENNVGHCTVHGIKQMLSEMEHGALEFDFKAINYNPNQLVQVVYLDFEVTSCNGVDDATLPESSIQTKFGSIIDCVDINKQPAFNHPLLKDHKLQRKPTFLNRRETTNKHALPTTTIEFELENDSCPTGSVPIRRTTKDDLIRMKSLSNLTRLSLINSAPYSHFVALHTKPGGNFSYFGVNGSVNVQNPRVNKFQMSLAQIAVQRGENDALNTILLGWQVYPELYGQETTNLFGLWTSDSFKTTGCYNMLCPGFVQTDNKIFLGNRVLPVSSYGGPQYDLSMSIKQDPDTKNWWLTVKDINVGYFPAALFSNMSEANLVGWGGRAYGDVNGTSPQMGSGYFPDGDMTHACFVRRLSYNENGSFEEPQEHLLYKSFDNQHCYDIQYFGIFDEDFRYTFQFGGPGGNCSSS